jgi:hypothetical protein
MKEIELSQGKKTIIDDEDFEELSKYNWYCNAQGYSVRSVAGDRSKKIRMHRVIINCPDSHIVDHINGNRLDNRKSNLRITDSTGNARNTGLSTKNTSGHTGVSFVKRVNKYRAYITIDYKQIHLGYFKTIEDAKNAYETAAKTYHGEFNRSNINH